MELAHMHDREPPMNVIPEGKGYSTGDGIEPFTNYGVSSGCTISDRMVWGKSGHTVW